MINKYAGTEMEKILHEAFNKESQARNRYTFYASKARQDKTALGGEIPRKYI